MTQAHAPAVQARELVQVRTRVPGGPWFIELTLAPRPPVALGPYDNPATAREEAKQIMGFVEALLRQAGLA